MDKDNIYVLRDIDCFMSVTEAIREQGLTLENRIIEKKVIESNYYLSKQLNVPLATKLFYLCRVHMQYIEHPIAGDPKYGPRKTIQANGQLLHACALEFVHPTTKEKMRFEIGLEPTFERVLNELREGEE